MKTSEKLFTEFEAAALLRVAAETLRAWRRQRRIGFLRVGRAALYASHHIDDFLRAAEVQPLPGRRP